MEKQRMKTLFDMLLPDDPEKAKETMEEFDVLMMRYESAMREVRTKLEILNDELSLKQDSPIVRIQSRRKKSASILEKLHRLNYPISLESIEANLSDVAGIRVICSFIDDIYKVAQMLAEQDDIKILCIKDYLQNPKPNGYRSYHMIVEIPVFFSNEKRPMQVEVQIRTVAMDFWASIEHQLKYKKNLPNAEEIMAELKECADVIAATDEKFLDIREKSKAR